MTDNTPIDVDEKTHPRWDAMWKNGLKPGDAFDILVPSPALIKCLADGLVPEGRALVPGCGRGYDLIALASPTRNVIGLDISEVAIQSAIDHFNSLPPENKPSSDWVEFRAASFFDFPISSENDKFDFIYDYTFFCALNPSIRPTWAKKMKSLLKVGGILITIIFPIREPDEAGPPFAVSLDIYKHHLIDTVTEEGTLECLRLEPLPEELCHNPTRRNSGIGIWKRIV